MTVRPFLKLLYFLAILLLLAFLGLALWYFSRQIQLRWQHLPLYGQLEYDAGALPDQSLGTEHFRMDWSAGSGTLRITAGEGSEKLLWASIPGESFLHGASGSESFEEHRGSFFFRNHLDHRYKIQEISSIDQIGDTLAIRGFLRNTASGTEIPYTVRFFERDAQTLAFSAEVLPQSRINRLYLTYASDAGEQFFGFGEQFSHINMKGRRLPVWVSEQGIGRGKQPLTFLVDLFARSGGTWYTSYAPVPHYITSGLRSLYLSTYAYAVFDLRKPDRVQVTSLDNRLEGAIFSGESPAALIAAYTAFSGRMAPLPDWIQQGAVIGLQGGTEKIRRVTGLLLEAGVPVAALWLQDWVGQRTTSFGKQLWWNWELDTTHYHGWESLRNDLEAQGIRVMGYINPFLVDVSAKPWVGRNLLEEARERNLLVKDTSGAVLMVMITDFSGAMLDLSNPAAEAWITEVIRETLIGEGFSGWMADFGEALPTDAVLHDGDALRYHNRYPERWSEVNRMAVDAADSSGQMVFFNRSAYTHSPGSGSLFWLGDQTVTWDRHDGLKTAVTGLISSGLSGFSLNHSDIGGYTTITNKPLHIVRSKELLRRWTELNAFTAVFRTHEGNRPADNAQVYDDAESLDHFARFAQIYTALAPYRKKLMQEAAATGLPLVRHPFIHYPEESEFHHLRYEQFMLGPDLMVAPVTERGADRVRLFLPTGRWVHVFTGELMNSPGEYISVDAPMGCPAVFARDGSSPVELLRAFRID